MKRKKIVSLILLAFFLSLFWANYGASQQVVPEKQNPKTQMEKGAEKIISSPRNIKEKTAIYVFLGWMWMTIFVLIYILRLKIKEADRLYLYLYRHVP